MEDEILCHGGYDSRGQCPYPDSCMPAKSGDCWNNCPATCGEHEMMCPGEVGPDGCPMPDFCIWNDPHHGSFCPVTCSEEEMFCSGGVDPQSGWAMPDFCIPMNGDCPTFCPAQCGPNEMMCPGEPDPNMGCTGPDFCIHYDHSAICNDACPIHCPMNEWPCPMGQDDMGCNRPMECSVDGKCPEDQM